MHKIGESELPPLFWERHRPIKTDTYFRTFQIRPPSENNYSFKPNYSMTLCAANRLQSVSPLVQFIWFSRESLSSCVGRLLLLIMTILFYPNPAAFNAFIVHCWNLPKGQNTNSEHKCHTAIPFIAFLTPCVCLLHIQYNLKAKRTSVMNYSQNNTEGINCVYINCI